MENGDDCPPTSDPPRSGADANDDDVTVITRPLNDADRGHENASRRPPASPPSSSDVATKPVATAPQMRALRSALRERLQDDMLNQCTFMGDSACVDTLVSLFERTATAGQNQSGLLIGGAGAGKKQIVASALRQLRARCSRAGVAQFTHVYLNGTILQNEIEAFKELLAQLARDTSIKHPVLSYSSMYTYLRSLLRAKAEAKTPVIVILDGLEHFAHKSSAKQLLLYNLLDWLQFRDVQMGVLGVTEDFCIMDSLEKRVRSRFSKLQIVVPMRSFEATKTMLRDAFMLSTIDWERVGASDTPSQAFITAFDARVNALFTHSDEFAGLQAVFENQWDKSRSPAYFVRFAVSAASFLTQDHALLSPYHFQRALQLLEPDYQLATLHNVSNHGIGLLIGMSHLENEGHAFFTLEMVYRKWQDFFRKHDILKAMPTRSEAQRELEILIELQLVEDAGDPFRISRVKHAPANFLQPEYRAVHLNLEPKVLQNLIRNGSIECSTDISAWMDVPSVSSPSDGRHPVKKKYLVARNRERKSSIFDYVNLSSSLLRKVRYGQSLDIALQARSPWSAYVASPGSFLDQREAPTEESPVSIWRDTSDTSYTVESSSRRNDLTKLSRRVEKALPGEGAIRYGRQIQLQATDGGFLALDTDGYLVKRPQSYRDDPSTLLTLFPQDPLRVPGGKLHVRTGEMCFVVLGAATVATDHQVLYADSRRIVDPPAALRNAVIRHQRQHRGGRANSQTDLTASRSRDEEKRSIVWSFRSTTVKPSRDVLDDGMLVQLVQHDLTMHYETEQIVKKKYKHRAMSGPEADEPATRAETGPIESAPVGGMDENDQERTPQSPKVTHVWLQRNDISSQHDTRASRLASLKTKQWDNLWFIIDVATDRKRERELKQREAVMEAERDAELRCSDDFDERSERDASRHKVMPGRKQSSTSAQGEREPREEGNNNNNDEGDKSRTKRLSVLNARVFVSAEAEEAQRHAAAIIVRFMRRVFRREAERRAKDLIDRRIRRTGKHHRYGELEDCTLSTMQQLRILQCFKPDVFGSQRALEPIGSNSRRIPGISLQGSKYPRQEAQRLASMQRDLCYLGSEDFQQQQVVIHRSTQRPLRNQDDEESSLALKLRTKHQKLSAERDREHKYHVQLAMVHREKPPFRFGKMDLRLHAHQRPHTAPASPIPKK